MGVAKKLFDSYMELLSDTMPGQEEFAKLILKMLKEKFGEKKFPLYSKEGDGETMVVSEEVLLVLEMLLETIKTNLYIDIVYNNLLDSLLDKEMEE